MSRNHSRNLRIVVLTVLTCGYSQSAVRHLVYVPLTLHAESQSLRTTACLQVGERIYPETPVWNGFGGDTDVPEKAFANVIDAFVRKDRTRLQQLSDPGAVRDGANFERQAAAFFQQFEAMQIVAVPRAYEFNDLVVFFAKIRSGKGTFFAPLVFALEIDGSYRFLPARTSQLAYQLVTDWFDAPWGPSQSSNPSYCSEAEIKRATHRVWLMPSANSSQPSGQPAYAFLRGASMDKPGQLGGLAAQTRPAVRELKNELAAGRIQNFIARVTPDGGSRLKQWFATADQTEKEQFQKAIAEQEPFYIFDAGPLIVVYTKSLAKLVQVMYFISSAKKELLWANSSHVTVLDGVFKRGPMYESASLDEPFKSFELK